MTYIEKFWRDATAADVARVMAGETVEARFRDLNSDPWFSGDTPSVLIGVKAYNRETPLWLARYAAWKFCQVYAPPQWFVDKPDPGEGYRLLGKFPDEPVQGGDFKKNTGGCWTELANGCNPVQAEGIWYRRRIEQPKPEPKHYSLQVGDTCHTPNGHRITVTEYGVEVS